MDHSRAPGRGPFLTPSGLSLEDAKTVLITALKKRYKLQYDAIQPIPYIKDRLYCVDKLFVEGCAVTESGKRLSSYKDIFTDSDVKAKRRIIEAEAGYGKSTVTLQLAYDWCNGVKDSPVKNVEILILLRLRQLKHNTPIHQAIKNFLVPNTTQIKSTDIKFVIENSYSVEVLLDGYDEYPDRDRDIDRGSDVRRIITMKMFDDFYVAMTTKYLPTHYDRSNTKRVRLVGFDDKARDQYIRKAVTGDDEESVAKIKRALKDNPILDDMCQVPLFFVMFAHMTHEKTHFQNFKSVTGFFRYMIRCFHSHLRNKSLDKNAVLYNVQYEVEHSELSKVAFEGLNKENQQLTWSKDEMMKRLGQAFYDYYIAVGILVEEEVFDVRNREIEVRFCHKLFCEWYACFTLVEVVARTSKMGLNSCLRNIDPFDLQYLYRFSCGIDSTVGTKLIEYLKTKDGGDKFAILCILEQTLEVDNIKETIRDLCSKEVVLEKGQNRLLQRSTIQLLDIAAKYDMKISCVTLNQSFEQVDKDEIKLRSGLSLPKLLTVEKIHIETEEDEKKDEDEEEEEEKEDEVRELSEDDVMKICTYALGSKELKEVSFEHCLLPRSLTMKGQAAEIIKRNIKVTWCLCGYPFNFKSGLWEVNDVNTVRRLCSSDVTIMDTDSKLLQTCTILLLENASNNNIPISCVTLNQSFEQVDKDEIKLRSGLSLPKLLTVEKIHIETEEDEEKDEEEEDEEDDEEDEEELREVSEDEVMKICVYALGSKKLKEISFGHCLLPLSFSRTVQAGEIINRNIKVTWCRYGYCFNFQSGLWEVEDVHTVRRLCSSEVEIWKHHSELLQRCTILLLENASNHDIPISSLYLWECSPRVYESALTPQSALTPRSGLILQCGLPLSILSSLQQLVICDPNRSLSTEEFVAILGYSSQCTSLENLKFFRYQLPETIPVNLIPLLLKSRKVKVWNYFFGNHQRLNLTTGLWQRCDCLGNLPGEEGFLGYRT